MEKGFCKKVKTLRENIVSSKESSDSRFSCNTQNVAPSSKQRTYHQDRRKTCSALLTTASSRSTNCSRSRSRSTQCDLSSCNDSLGVIEEDCDSEEPVTVNRDVKCDDSSPSSSSEPEEDPCADFFGAMREAVKNSVEDMRGGNFITYLGKLDNLAKQLECTQCRMTKFYNHLVKKIASYGDLNSQKFEYLCLRIEHDYLFYQQVQKYFLNRPKRPSCTPKDGSKNEKNPKEVKKSSEPQAETVVAAKRRIDVKNKDKAPEKSQADPVVAASRSSRVRNKDNAPEKRDDKRRAKSPIVRSQVQIGDQNKGGKRTEVIEPEIRPEKELSEQITTIVESFLSKMSDKMSEKF